MARAVQRPAARRDFIIHYVYLAENAGLDVAKRFRQAVESAYAQLAEDAGYGRPRKTAPTKTCGSSDLASPRILGGGRCPQDRVSDNGMKAPRTPGRGIKTHFPRNMIRIYY